MTPRIPSFLDPTTASAERPSSPSLEAFAAGLVGSDLLWVVQDSVRKGMLREALERTAGNYTQAARLLGVQRQAVQQMVARFGIQAWVDHVRSHADAASSSSERGDQQASDAYP